MSTTPPIAPDDPQETPLPVPLPRPPTPKPARRPRRTPEQRRKRWGRILRAVAALLLLAFVSSMLSLVLWVNSSDFQRRIVPIVESLVEQRAGEAFTLGGVDVDLWPPSVEALDARLWHIDTGETIVHVASIRAPVVFRAGGPRLGTLRFERPTIDLHLDADGLREFRKAPTGGPKLAELPWTALDVRDGTVRLHHTDGVVELLSLQVIPTEAGRHEVRGTVHGTHGDLDETFDLSWGGVALGPKAIEVPDLRVDTRFLQVEGRALLPLDGPVEATVKVTSDLPAFNEILVPPRKLYGSASVEAVFSGQGEDLAADIALSTTAFGFDLKGIQEAFPVLHYQFGDAEARVHATLDGATLESLVLDTGGGVITVTGRVTRELTAEDVEVTATDLSMEHVLIAMGAAPTPWTDFTGQLDATLAGTLNPMRLEGPFEVKVEDWVVGDGPVSRADTYRTLVIPWGTGKGSLVIEKDNIQIYGDEVAFPKNRGRVDCNIGFGPFGPLDLRAHLDHADLSDLRPLGDSELFGVGTLSGRMWGPFNKLQFAGDGDMRGFSVTGIPYADRLVSPVASPDMKSIVMKGAQAQVGETRYHGDFTLGFEDPMTLTTDIVVDDGRVEDLIGMFVDIEGLTGAVKGTLVLDGPLFDMDGEAHLDLTDVEVYGEHFPAGEGHGVMNGGLFTLDDLRLLREDGRAGIMMRGSVQRDYALNMELVADGFRLETLDHLVELDLPLSGRASVVARIDNKIYDPAPHGRIAVTDVRYAGQPVGDSVVKFETENAVTRFQGKLVAGSVALVGTMGLWDEQPYQLFASFVDFPVSVLYPTGADGRPVGGRLTGQLELDGHLGDVPSPVAIDGEVRDLELTWGRHTLRNADTWHYAQRGEYFEMTGFGIEGGSTTFALSKVVRDEAGLDVQGGGRLDLDLLRLVVPDLLRSEGWVDLDMAAIGAGGQIETVLDGQVYGSLLRHTSFPAPFEDVRATFTATDDGYEILDLSAGLGGGTLTGEGRIDAKGWVPFRWNVAAHAHDAQVQWIDALPPAIGDAELTFDGPVDALLLSGDVIIHEMDFTDRIDWEDWVVAYRSWSVVEATPFDDDPWFSIDIGIIADDTIRLRNNVAEGTASADLRVIGDTVRPGLLGRIAVRDGNVYLQDREFQVDRGLISYRDPWTWDPDLDIDLVTDITSRDTRYRVHYLIRGPFSDWRTETRSEPSLPQADVNALLWFGVTADDLEGMGELPQAVAQGVADMILTDLFITRGGGVREELGSLVDRVEIATGVDSRGEYSPDPRIVLEKRLDAADATARVEINTVQWDDWQAQADFRITESWSLALWYARKQRERVLSIGGAYGVDLRARWEME